MSPELGGSERTIRERLLGPEHLHKRYEKFRRDLNAALDRIAGDVNLHSLTAQGDLAARAWESSGLKEMLSPDFPLYESWRHSVKRGDSSEGFKVELAKYLGKEVGAVDLKTDFDKEYLFRLLSKEYIFYNRILVALAMIKAYFFRDADNLGVKKLVTGLKGCEAMIRDIFKAAGVEIDEIDALRPLSDDLSWCAITLLNQWPDDWKGENAALIPDLTNKVMKAVEESPLDARRERTPIVVHPLVFGCRRGRDIYLTSKVVVVDGKEAIRDERGKKLLPDLRQWLVKTAVEASHRERGGGREA